MARLSLSALVTLVQGRSWVVKVSWLSIGVQVPPVAKTNWRAAVGLVVENGRSNHPPYQEPPPLPGLVSIVIICSLIPPSSLGSFEPEFQLE